MLGRKEHHKFLEFTKTIIELSTDKKREDTDGQWRERLCWTQTVASDNFFVYA